MHDAYFSYWSAGYRKMPDYNYLLMQKISLAFAKKSFNKVHLITDSRSLPYLENMGWDSISTDLDSIDPSLGGIWSLGKIYAYKIAAERGSPFIHIDYDVILWNGMPYKIAGAEVFAQSREEDAYNSYEIKKFLEHCPDPSYISYGRNIAVNMGIFGGTDMDFIKFYATEAIKLAENKTNYNFWTSFENFAWTWNMATIVEQYFLITIATLKSKKITCLFDSRENNGYPSNDMAFNIGYTHFMGDKDHKNFIPRLKQIAKDNCINIDI